MRLHIKRNYYLMLISLLFIAKENLLAQSCTFLIKEIKEKIMHFENKWMNADSIDLIVKQSNISNNCYLTNDVYSYILKMSNDSLPKIRLTGYIITNYSKDTSNRKLFIFSKAVIDQNRAIRRWVNFYYFNEDDIWLNQNLKNKELINNLKTLFEKYPTEIEFGTIRIIGKYKYLQLKPFLQKLANGNQINKYDKDFFSSTNWISLMALARMQDSLSLKKVINILKSTENAFSLFEEISWLYQYIPNKVILNFIIDLALSDKSLERMYPIDRDDTIGPTFLDYTIIPVLRESIINFPSNEVYNITNEKERISFVRNWLRKNRNQLIIKQIR